MDMMPIGPGYLTPFDYQGYMSQPFTPTASGLPSLLRICGGNPNWSMQVSFEIWCDGQLCARRVADPADYEQYSLNGYAFNLSFYDIADRKPIQAGKPCELRIATLTSSMGEATFGVSLFGGAPGFGGLKGMPYPDLGNSCVYMGLTVV